MDGGVGEDAAEEEGGEVVDDVPEGEGDGEGVGVHGGAREGGEGLEGRKGGMSTAVVVELERKAKVRLRPHRTSSPDTAPIPLFAHLALADLLL